MKLTRLTPDAQILKELGTRLAKARKHRGLTQGQLAEQAGIGVATLRRIEGGQDSQMASWIKLLRAMELTSSIDHLLPETIASPMAEAMAEKRRRRLEAAISPI